MTETGSKHFSIEGAMCCIYDTDMRVRREAWEPDLKLVVPIYEGRYKLDAPIIFKPGGEKRTYIPTMEDMLREDWYCVDGPYEPDPDDEHGFYKAMKYLYATGTPVRVSDWYPETYVYVDNILTGDLRIHFEEDGVEADEIYIPSKQDYLSIWWEHK